jgi:3'(2'), 5'-bisphosphate nucleotidase
VPASKSELLERVNAIARGAGALVMSVYRSDFSARRKDDASPVTEADERAEALIVSALRTLTPQIPIVAEEEVAAGRIPEVGRVFWLVDPLDGTKEFIKRNGEFTVNIALVDRDRPVLGVVYAPALQLMYFAATGVGAWRQRGGGAPERIYSEPPTPGARLRVVESRSHRSETQDAFLATLDVSERISIGSSLKFCLVAEGTAISEVEVRGPDGEQLEFESLGFTDLMELSNFAHELLEGTERDDDDGEDPSRVTPRYLVSFTLRTGNGDSTDAEVAARIPPWQTEN